MPTANFGSRKLLLLLAFVLLNSQSISFSKLPVTLESTLATGHSYPNKQDEELHIENDVLWLVDTASGLCLGSRAGFSQCNENNLWLWSSTPKRSGQQHKTVKLRAVLGIDKEDSSARTVSGECLGRNRGMLLNTELKMLPCTARSTSWTFEEDLGKLTDGNNPLAKLLGPVCISSEESMYNTSSSLLKRCKKGFAHLKRVVLEKSSPLFAHLSSHKPRSSIAEQLVVPNAKPLPYGSFTDVGSWKCPVTGLLLPRNLDDILRQPAAVAAVVDQADAKRPTGSKPKPEHGQPSVLATRGGESVSNSIESKPVDFTKSGSSNRQVLVGSGVFSKVSCQFHTFPVL
jgi:hypothetical protein